VAELEALAVKIEAERQDVIAAGRRSEARVASLEAALRGLLAAIDAPTGPDFTLSNRMHAIGVACEAARAALRAERGEGARCAVGHSLTTVVYCATCNPCDQPAPPASGDTYTVGGADGVTRTFQREPASGAPCRECFGVGARWIGSPGGTRTYDTCPSCGGSGKR
jgi:hypothetical protein